MIDLELILKALVDPLIRCKGLTSDVSIWNHLHLTTISWNVLGLPYRRTRPKRSNVTLFKHHEKGPILTKKNAFDERKIKVTSESTRVSDGRTAKAEDVGDGSSATHVNTV